MSLLLIDIQTQRWKTNFRFFHIFLNFLFYLLLRVHTMHNVTRQIGLHRATWGRLDERRAPASVAQWSEHSSRKRKVRGSSPRRVTPYHVFIKFSPIYLLICEHSLVTLFIYLFFDQFNIIRLVLRKYG